MTAGRVRRLLGVLPEEAALGDVEIYFHPAARRDALIGRLMPGYDHEGEMAALLDPGVRAALRALE
jgi:hypothetical protein